MRHSPDKLSGINDRGCTDERVQVRKVRAPQGRMPDNIRWRRLQGQCNRNNTASAIRGFLRSCSKPCNGFRRFAKRYAEVRVEWQCKRLPPSR